LPLNLGPISQDMERMAQKVLDLTPAHDDFLRRAQDLLRTVDTDALRQKLEDQRRRQVHFPWLVGTPYASLSAAVAAPPPPADFCVVGCDGSSIPPDRNISVHYYVLNAGYALLVYGNQPNAALASASRLCFEDQDLYVFPEQRDVPIEGVRLGARMEVESLRIVQEGAQPPYHGLPTVVLRDGPLTLWTLQSEDEAIQDALLHGFLNALEFLRQANVPVAGYVSYTEARDLANSLRLWICQGKPNECAGCTNRERDLCQALAGIRDRELFSFLATGERSGWFASSSDILRRYGEHRIDFCYLNAGGEIARVEVPQWVRSSPPLANLLHASLADQCRRSPGFPPYPPALQEAHEQAVITAAERQLVDEMVERALGRRGQHLLRSAKETSKRRRGV